MLTPKTANSLIAARQQGLWAHKSGLNLYISSAGTATWAFRYSTKGSGKRRLMTLAAINTHEPVTAASLKVLEYTAEGLRFKVRTGFDPLAEKEASATKRIAPDAEDSFENAAKDYIAANESGWKNPVHNAQWKSTLKTYVYPIIGKIAPHEITIDNVLAVMNQKHGEDSTLWKNARETANRVRARIENVISAAKAKGITNPATRDKWSGHTNPAQWKDGLKHFLNGKQVKGHHTAMDWNDVPAFYAELCAKIDYSAYALRLTILCAVRTSEALNAKWDEIDLEKGVWIIPAARMKAGREHRVPLSTDARSLLETLPRVDGNPYIFPGVRKDRPLSNMAMLMMLRGLRNGLTVHGFRSAFRDWISETTNVPDAIAEQALAHTINDKTVAAYRRGDAFERRNDLMQQWSDYLTTENEFYRNKWSRLIA